MTLAELRYLVSLADERHFGRAAERCWVSQPTLSMAIKRLEKELGVELFERLPVGVRLTPVGEAVIARAHRAVEHTREMERLARNADDPLADPVLIGACDSMASYYLPRLRSYARQHRPGLLERTAQGEPSRLVARLCRGELDVILVSGHFTHPDTVTRPVHREPFVVLLPRSHPLAQQSALLPDMLNATSVLLPTPEQSLRQEILLACPELDPARFHPGVPEGASASTLGQMVALGEGVAIVPQSSVQASGLAAEGALMRPLTPPRHRTLALVWRTSFPRHTTVDWLARAIAAVAPVPGWLKDEPRADGLLVENSYW